MPDENKGREDAPETTVSEPAPTPSPTPQKQPFFKRIWTWIATHKKVAIPVAIVLLAGILAAVPFTRYAIAGTFLKQNFSVNVVDPQTKQPVTSAKVTIAGISAVTDNKGKAMLKAPVGSRTLTVSKKYFKSSSQNIVVPILKQKDIPQVTLQATGRQVQVSTVNFISKQPLADVTVKAADTEAKTDSNGIATLVVPANANTVKATFKTKGYTEATYEIKVLTNKPEDNKFTLTPEGKIYVLSTQSGTLDLVKVNLDGTGRQVVLAGTGKEDKQGTGMLASRDWRYIALKSRRDSKDAKVYLIDTQTNKLSVIDEGEGANFELSGWHDHTLVYKTVRTKVELWQPKRIALKSYNADTQKLTTLDQTTGSGDANFYNYEDFGNVFVLANEVVYIKTWNFSKHRQVDDPSFKNNFVSIGSDGKNKRIVKTYDRKQGDEYFFTGLQRLKSHIYVSHTNYNGGGTYDEYKNGQMKASSVESDEFYREYANSYVLSPSGEKTVWFEKRDSRQVVFVGDKNSENGKQIGITKEYSAYRWFNDDYILLNKSNQLYIAPVSGFTDDTSLTLVTAYLPTNIMY